MGSATGEVRARGGAGGVTMLEVRGLTRRGRARNRARGRLNGRRTREGARRSRPLGRGKDHAAPPDRRPRAARRRENRDRGPHGLDARLPGTPWERGIGLVPQHSALWPHMRVADQVAYAARGGADAREEALEALARCRVDRLADRFPAELSGGEARRVAMARALAARPALLLMDEPLAHLDAALRETIASLVDEFRRETGCTLVVAIHDADEAARMTGGDPARGRPRGGARGRGTVTEIRPAVEVAIGIGLVIGLLVAGQVVLGIVEGQRLPETWQAVRPPDDVTALLVNRDLVYAGGSGGLFMVERGSGRLVAMPEEAPTIGQVGGIVRDRAGEVWVAHDRGVALRADGKWEDRTPPACIGPRRVLAVAADADSRVWAGGEGGLACLENGTWTAVAPPSGWPFPSIDVLYTDNAGILWAGSRSPTNGGLCRFDGESWAFFTDTGSCPTRP